jgi:hypothetical protein
MPAVEHDHAGARAEDRAREALDRLVEPVQLHEPHERRRLTARDHERVEPFELRGQPDLDGIGAEPAQHRYVLAEVPLEGEHTDLYLWLHDPRL